MQSTNSFLPHFMITCRVMWVRIARKTCTKPWHFSLCWRWLSSVWPTSGIQLWTIIESCSKWYFVQQSSLTITTMPSPFQTPQTINCWYRWVI